MEVFEGTLLHQLEPNSFLGKAVWKPRYIVLGPAPQPFSPAPRISPSSTRKLQSPKSHASRSQVSLTHHAPLDGDDKVWLSLYKQTGDIEPIARYPADSIKSCHIEDMVDKKSRGTLRTLVINLSFDRPNTPRSSRRSSQSGSFSSISRHRQQSLLFRSGPNEPFLLDDWCAELQSRLNPPPSRHLPIDTFNTEWDWNSPPVSNARPVSKKRMFSTQGQTRTMLLSPSPSVRSQGSDCEKNGSEFDKKSSRSRAPSSLPSPSSDLPRTPLVDIQTTPRAIPDSQASHGRESPATFSTLSDFSQPSPRRETILDRAFNMNGLTGSPTPELNSIARFEALMTDIETRARPESTMSASPLPNEEYSPLPNLQYEDPMPRIPTPTKKALEFISGKAPLPPPPQPQLRPETGRRSRPTSIILYEGLVEKRNSVGSARGGNSTPAKRLSFGDVARRLSSSSLLFQTTSSRQSSVSDFACAGYTQESSDMSCLTAMPQAFQHHRLNAMLNDFSI